VIFYLFATYTAPLWNNRVSKRIGLGPPNQKECLRGAKSECADARAGSSHDPPEPPARDPPDKLHDPPGDPTYEPPQPRTDPTSNPASDPPLNCRAA